MLAYVSASARLLKRQRQIQVTVFGVICGLLVLTLVAAGVIMVQRERAVDQAREAESDRLAAEAGSTGSSQPDLAQLLAAESLLTKATDEARSAAINALQVPIHPAVSLPSGADSVSAVAVTHDGHLVASADGDGRVVLRDGADVDAPARTLDGTVALTSPIAVSDDGRFVVAVDDSYSLLAWDTASGRLVHRVPLSTQGAAVAAAFRPSTLEVAVVSEDPNVVGVDLASPEPEGRVLARLDKQPKQHQGVAYSPNGNILAVAEGRQIRMWDLTLSRPLTQWPIIEAGQVNGIAFSPDGALVAAASDDRTVRLWRLGAGNDPIATGIGHDDTVTDVAFSPDGAVLASSSDDHSVRLWAVSSPAQLREVDMLSGHAAQVNDVVFADASRVVSASDDGTLRVWQTTVDNGGLIKTQASVMTLAFSPEDRLLAAGDEDGWLTVWDTASRKIGARIRTRSGAERAVTQVRFTPDGKSVVTAGADGSVAVWSLKPAERTLSIVVGPQYIAGMDLSADGNLVATGNGAGLVQLWDTRTGLQVGDPIQAHQGRVDNVVFSPGGALMASTGSDDATIRLWDVATHEQVGADMKADRGSAAWGVAFSPDGETLATTGSDFSLRLWSVSRQVLLEAPERGHRGATDGVAFSPDGKLIATTSADQTVRLWHPDQRGQVGSPLRGHGSWVDPVTFSHSGRLLATASVGQRDRSIRLWTLDADSWVSGLCRRSGRNLTMEEWRHFRDGPYLRTCAAYPAGVGAPSDAPAR